ncbi:MAG: hypothetical protein LBT46_00135 [Planctomycetaceae bacterium]|jgi:Ni/Co efflux regulator RcnB|nr:hypothetical protein [Planctomycetaceae bacterium]
MKSLPYLAVLTAAFIVSLTLPCPAQNAAPPTAPPRQINLKQVRRDAPPKAAVRNLFRSQWNGTSTGMVAMQLIYNEKIRKAWNISDEQYGRMTGDIVQQLASRPEWLEIQAEIKKIQKPDDPAFQNADAETKQKWEELRERQATFMIDNYPREAGKLLTQEQRQKMREFQLATMSAAPIISPDMFEGLGLSDEQKRKMDNIKKGLESEYIQNTDEMMDAMVVYQEKIYEKIEKENGSMIDAKEFGEKMRAAEEALKSEGEFKKIMQSPLDKSRALVTRLKIKMFDVLTDEQWAKLQDLIDNPPDYVKEELAKMKKQFGDDRQSDVWQPGINTWKPGDAVPEEYRQERAKRKAFPQKEKDK